MEITLKNLNECFSESRLLPYTHPNSTPNEIAKRYNDNIKICEAMIPILHYLEVCLRNRIDAALKNHYAENWFINHHLISEVDLIKIEKLSIKFKRDYKRPPSHDDLISQMTFGFWCSFFHKKYDPIIWHKKETFKIIFPNLERKNRNRIFIESKILKVKSMRNRIAHHEPIWNGKISISDIHHTCFELIEAMSSEAAFLLKKIDRFQSVYEGCYSTKKTPDL
jgi:hypothetical protein